MIFMTTEKINFWIKDGEFHLSYNGTSLTQAKDGYDRIMDYCDRLIAVIHEECIPKLLRGETCKIDLLDNPHTLIFVPRGDLVTIIFETEVIQGYEPRKEFTAPLEEWFRAVQEGTLDIIQQMRTETKAYFMIPVSTLIEDYQTTEKRLQKAGYAKGS